MARTLPVLSLLVGALACGEGVPAASDAGTDASDVSPEPPDPIPEEGPLEGMTAAHNEIRGNAEPRPDPPLAPLLWDPHLAAIAQRWADHLAHELECPFPLPHSDGPYGENLAWIYNQTTTGPGVVLSWGDEQRHYDYDDNTCSFICGHYTQIVWRTTERVGCGRADCPSDDDVPWEVWVCNYDPPGNIGGQRPY